MENIVLNLDSWQVFLGMFGPLVVAAITGLKSETWIKSVLAVVVVCVFTAVDVYIRGTLSVDLFGSIVAVAVIWQTFYTMLWKPTNIGAWLQKNVPIKLGE
jgi:hypothetical protein